MEKVAPILEVANDHPYISLASAVLGCAALIRLVRRRRYNLPPGPKGYPIIGNLFDMPPTHSWEKFGEFGKLYGGVTYLNVVGQGIIILNTFKAATDLLEKRSSNYSNRPIAMMSGEILGWNRSVGFLQYGPKFREFRKYMKEAMGTRASVEKYGRVQQKEIVKLLARTLADPSSLPRHIRKATGAIILMVAYGYSVRENDDPFLEVVEASVNGFSETAEPGAFLVDTIPSLRFVPEWFPGAGWKTKGRLLRKTVDDTAELPFQFVKDQMAAGMAIPSFVSDLLGSMDVTPEIENNIKWSAASLYSGASDTTIAAVHTFYLVMVLYPEIQRKAQAEIDRVVGNDRFPGLADQDKLPYVDAVVKEVLRWKPVGPMGMPHTAAEDDVYEGCLIPKGSMLLANIWEILHDPETYPNPMEFNPERFLRDDPEQDPREAVFGFGRRLCPGLNIAQTSLWLSCAMALAVFDIGKYVDKFGNVVEPETRYGSGVISHPPPFKCSIKPRSEKSAALVASAEF